MQINERVVPQGIILDVVGDLTYANRGLFKGAVEKAKSAGCRHLIVNLEKVPFIDSHGLAALVIGLKIFDDGDKLRLVAPQAQPKLLFELTMFDQIFHITDNVTTAKATL